MNNQHNVQQSQAYLASYGGKQHLSAVQPQGCNDDDDDDDDDEWSSTESVMSTIEEELLEDVGESAMTSNKTSLSATITSVSDETDVAGPAAKTPPQEPCELEYFMAKNIDDITHEERKADPDMQRWYDIVNLLGDKAMDFTWSEETHCVIAALCTHWDRLQATGRGHLLTYRTTPFPEFKAFHRGSRLPLVPVPGNPKLLYMQYKIKSRLDMQEKGIRMVQLTAWDGEDDPWARRHFFNVVEMGARVYLMMKNTIEMGYLTWNKDKAMLSGPPGMWNMHQVNEIKAWKGMPFPDFDSWAYILDQPIDITKLVQHAVLAPNAYRYFYGEINGTAAECANIKYQQAPHVFGVGTSNRIAKRMWHAIQQYKLETYQLYINLTHPQVEYNPENKSLIGTDEAWEYLGSERIVNDIGFNGTVWKDKEPKLLHRGFYAFEDVVACHAEQTMRRLRTLNAERMLADPKMAKSKRLIKEVQQLRKEVDYRNRRVSYQDKKLSDSKERKAAPGGEVNNGGPSVSCAACHADYCIACGKGCVVCNHGLIRAMDIHDRECINYRGLPTTRLQIDLLFEPTEPRTLQTILEEFKLLQGFDDKPFFAPLANFNFSRRRVATEFWSGTKILRPGRRGQGLVDTRESPFRLRSCHFGADDYMGNDIYIVGEAAGELYRKGFIPGLRKMVAFAGEGGRKEMLEYFAILHIDTAEKGFEPVYASFMEGLPDLSPRDEQVYRVKDNEWGFKSHQDLGFGIVLAQDLLTDECVPFLRKFVMDNGIEWRHIVVRRLIKEGIDVLDKLMLNPEDTKALLQMLKHPTTIYERLVVGQMKALRVFEESVLTIEMAIEVDAKAEEAVALGQVDPVDWGIQHVLDIGFGLRLKDGEGVRERNQVDSVLVDACRTLVLRAGAEWKTRSLGVLKKRGVEVVDLEGQREEPVVERRGWAKKTVRMSALERMIKKTVERMVGEEEGNG